MCIRSRSGHSTPRISHRERPSVFQSITFADSLKERKVKQDSLPDCSSIFNDFQYFQQRGCGAHTLCRGTDSVQLAPKSSVKTHTQPCSSAAKRDEMKADVCPGFASCLTDYWGEILDSDQAGGCWGGGGSLVCSAVLQQRAATDGIMFKWAAYCGRMAVIGH